MIDVCCQANCMAESVSGVRTSIKVCTDILCHACTLGDICFCMIGVLLVWESLPKVHMPLSSSTGHSFVRHVFHTQGGILQWREVPSNVVLCRNTGCVANFAGKEAGPRDRPET
jgi:hypothetical protein